MYLCIMYDCMYVFLYVRMYVCMYVCVYMYVCVCVCMYIPVNLQHFPWSHTVFGNVHLCSGHLGQICECVETDERAWV